MCVTRKTLAHILAASPSRCHALLCLFALLIVSAFQPFSLSAFCSTPYDIVTVPKVKTSVYVGTVTLTMTPFKRGADEVYTADYKATVVPFFFFGESGQLRITFNGDQLARLERGERVEFSGDGKNASGAARPITGYASADTPGAKTGKIKVRVFVTKKTALIFDTTYEFTAEMQADAKNE